MSKIVIYLNAFIIAVIVFFGSNNAVKAEETQTAIVEQTTKANKPIAPKFFKGIDKGKSIKLSWTKVKNAKGYIIYRNGKKIKTIKKGKIVKFTDKKVKYSKKYKYCIKSFINVNKKKNKSIKTYDITVKVAKKRYKVQNVNKIEFWNLDYNPMTYGEKQKVDPILISKYDKKKLSKKVRWFSSNKSLATVNDKGVVTINNNHKNGTVKIWAVAHNGYRKYKKIYIVDMMRPTKFDKDTFIDKFLNSLMKEHLADVKDIASYFNYERPHTNVLYEMDPYSEEHIKVTPNIDVDESIKKKISTLVIEESYDVEVKDSYIEFRTKHKVSDKGEYN